MITKKAVFFSIALGLIFNTYTFTQEFTVKLWPDSIPGSVQDTSYHEKATDEGGWFRISHVSDPDITIFLPGNTNSETPAILICPGGGYGIVAMDHEGYEVARWLNSVGIAGIVLKYRLPSDNIMKNKKTGPLQDAQKAMRIIRKNASEWNIMPDRIGVIGFSAGGHLAASLTTRYNEKVYPSEEISAKPDFSILIYPVISMLDSLTHEGSQINLLGENAGENLKRAYSNELLITKDTPPCFLIHSSDDGTVNYLNSVYFYQELIKHNVSSELHIFPYGGHGYGIAAHRPGLEIWPENLKNWLSQVSD